MKNILRIIAASIVIAWPVMLISISLHLLFDEELVDVGFSFIAGYFLTMISFLDAPQIVGGLMAFITFAVYLALIGKIEAYFPHNTIIEYMLLVIMFSFIGVVIAFAQVKIYNKLTKK